MLIDEHKKWIDAKLEQLQERLDSANSNMAREAQLRLLIQQARASIEAGPSAKK